MGEFHFVWGSTVSIITGLLLTNILGIGSSRKADQQYNRVGKTPQKEEKVAEQMACEIGFELYWVTMLCVKSGCFSLLSHRGPAYECSTGTASSASVAWRPCHSGSRQHPPPERLHWIVLSPQEKKTAKPSLHVQHRLEHKCWLATVTNQCG